MAKRTDMPSSEKAQFLLDTVEDRLAVNPVLLDLRDRTLLFDYLLVCSGNSDVHIRAITEKVLEETDERRLASPRVEGQAIAEWVLMDFGDVVLHILNEEARQRYKLEQFWSTPQPKGALIPTPDAIATGEGQHIEDVEDTDADEDGDFDDEDLDDEFDEDDEAFFEEADTEVEPVDEDELDDTGDSKKR